MHFCPLRLLCFPEVFTSIAIELTRPAVGNVALQQRKALLISFIRDMLVSLSDYHLVRPPFPSLLPSFSISHPFPLPPPKAFPQTDGKPTAFVSLACVLPYRRSRATTSVPTEPLRSASSIGSRRRAASG